ncbi:MAG: amino acid ABC transporter substrate-binding protein [Proteobacteria bacterium]|nr:amino acid ABC transporter substrate-binding protein [Pseudomonadota bacterium]
MTGLRHLLCSAPLLAALAVPAQDIDSTPANPGPQALTGTLAQVRASGSIALAYRDSSVPFSYLDARGQPIGYSIELCKSLVGAIETAVQRPLQIRWVPVTSATRMQAITSGQADLECGSTTSNLERQKTVAFSPTIFVAGTRLLVRKGSGLRDWRDLADKKVVVTAGTTNEQVMRRLSQRMKIPMSIEVAPDHAQAFAQIEDGRADAFATDDVLLYGLVAQTPGADKRLAVVGELLSYEPYAIMFRRGDPQLAKLVTDSMRLLAQDGEIDRQYRRWFLQKLPGTQQRLGLPMSAQLEAIVQSLAAAQVE